MATTTKKRANRPLYLFAAFLILIVVGHAIAAIVSDRAAVIFDPAYLRVLYGILSLAVAVATFGLIGDSEALVRSNNPKGLYFQVTGSGAGFFIFFLLLTWGLSPYTNLSLYLYKDKRSLLQPADGPVQITLVGRIRRSLETSDGSATFAYLPKSEDHRLVISGRSWVIDKVTPPKCLTEEDQLSARCELIEVYVKKAPPCLDQIAFISRESTPIKTNLDTLLRRFAETVQRASPDTDVTLSFSEALLKSNLQKKEFVIDRKSDVERSVCSHLADITRWFDNAQGKPSIQAYISCNRILILKSLESPPKEFRQCP